MNYDPKNLRRIYRRTDGKCHLCHKKLSLSNHGKIGRKGNWEIDHSRPRSLGGTDHLNNLFPACDPCNREKSNYLTKTARSWNGQKRAPLSPERKEKAREENAATGIFLGGLFGAIFGGVPWMIACALGGGLLGEASNPE